MFEVRYMLPRNGAKHLKSRHLTHLELTGRFGVADVQTEPFICLLRLIAGSSPGVPWLLAALVRPLAAMAWNYIGHVGLTPGAIFDIVLIALCASVLASQWTL